MRQHQGERPGRGARAVFGLGASLLCAGAGLLGGCLDDQLDPNMVPVGETFIAQPSDFATFRSWTRTEVAPADAPAITGAHLGGPREAYILGAPSGGVYPVGTIIVKTAEIGDPKDWEIHARTKRGGGFNPGGAIDWEWFELGYNDDGNVGIVWRGEKPPANHGYESLPGIGATSSTDGDCNTCHATARTTDYILAPALQAMLAGS